MSIIGIAIIAGIGASSYWYLRSRREETSSAASSALSAAGWRGDPTGRNESRYWDGSAWTTQVRTGGVDTVDPL